MTADVEPVLIVVVLGMIDIYFFIIQITVTILLGVVLVLVIIYSRRSKYYY